MISRPFPSRRLNRCPVSPSEPARAGKGRLRHRPPQAVAFAQPEIGHGQGLQQPAVQAEDGIQRGIPRPVRISQGREHISRGLPHIRGRRPQQVLHSGLDLLAQPLRLARARKLRASRQMLAAPRISDRAPAHRRMKELGHLPPQSHRGADPPIPRRRRRCGRRYHLRSFSPGPAKPHRLDRPRAVCGPIRLLPARAPASPGHAWLVARWIGVDVGGKRKGFDVAVIDDQRVLDLRNHLSCAPRSPPWSLEHHPNVVAVDSPRTCAPDGQTARDDEPPARQVDLRHPLDTRGKPGARERLLRLDPRRASICSRRSPPAGPRSSRCSRPPRGLAGTESEARGPARPGAGEALAALGLDGRPAWTNQDQPDAIAAAMTGRQHSLGRTETIGAIVVPARL